MSRRAGLIRQTQPCAVHMRKAQSIASIALLWNCNQSALGPVRTSCSTVPWSSPA